MWYAAPVHGDLPIKGITFNFMPSWWRANAGITYGERMVFDARYRLEAWRAMERTMHQRFGRLGMGDADPKPRVIAPDWHNAVTPAVAGCDVEYPDENYPISHHLPMERISRLEAPEDVAAAFPYREIIRQVREENSRLGADEPAVLPMRGVANDASLIRGADLFGDIVAEPESARPLLAWCHRIRMAIGAFNGGTNHLPNCCVMMVSPATYEQVFAPYDRVGCASAEKAGHPGSGIHHCGTFDRYAPLYRALGRFSWIEIGMDSDIRLAMETFPEAGTVSFIIDPYLMLRGSAAAVEARVTSALEAARGHGRRLHLAVADIESGTPDANIAAVVQTAGAAR
jgi:uroporphyrinogen-III decarboxylase